MTSSEQLVPVEQIAIDLAAHLAGAISLLKNGGKAAKKAAASDKLFDQMVKDYEASLQRARHRLAALRTPPAVEQDEGLVDAMHSRAITFLGQVGHEDWSLDWLIANAMASIAPSIRAQALEEAWQPIETAPIKESVGSRSAMILGADNEGRIEKTFYSIGHPKGEAWLIATGHGLEEWNPTLWTNLPTEFQDRDGTSYQHRRALKGGQGV